MAAETDNVRGQPPSCYHGLHMRDLAYLLAASSFALLASCASQPQPAAPVPPAAVVTPTAAPSPSEDGNDPLVAEGEPGPDSALEEAQAHRATPTAILHEPCETPSANTVTTDANGDGKTDMLSVVGASGNVVCRAYDLNFDGQMEVYRYFDARGQLRRTETDFNFDGRADEIALFVDGRLSEKHLDTNGDGRLDTWSVVSAAQQECSYVAIDVDGDGVPDERRKDCGAP